MENFFNTFLGNVLYWYLVITFCIGLVGGYMAYLLSTSPYPTYDECGDCEIRDITWVEKLNALGLSFLVVVLMPLVIPIILIVLLYKFLESFRK